LNVDQATAVGASVQVGQLATADRGATCTEQIDAATIIGARVVPLPIVVALEVAVGSSAVPVALRIPPTTMR
jgi:hypothetical protein